MRPLQVSGSARTNRTSRPVSGFPSRRRAVMVLESTSPAANERLESGEAPAADEGHEASAPNIELGDDGLPKRYLPSLDADDPINTAARKLYKDRKVSKFELLDSRWNGNEAFRFDLSPNTDGDDPQAEATEHGTKKPKDGAVSTLFVKLNRVEDPQVFMSEAISLSALLSAADSVRAPRPLHIGQLPRVGSFGPGAFMILQWFDLVPFGANRPEVQLKLAHMIADIHTSTAFEDVHKGSFGFNANNYLSLSPMDNTWDPSWPRFFAKRLVAQVNAAFTDKPYARAPLNPANEDDAALKLHARKIVAEINQFFSDGEVTPRLLHGDLWIGNVGASRDGSPVIYDPASFFGHTEFDLALMRMFGGYSDAFWSVYFERVPKAPGFEARVPLYELYQYLNQLNLFGDPAVKTKVFEIAKSLADDLNT